MQVILTCFLKEKLDLTDSQPSTLYKYQYNGEYFLL